MLLLDSQLYMLSARKRFGVKSLGALKKWFMYEQNL
jgi:hypothetical protein